jgi:dienelactone hydrolase
MRDRARNEIPSWIWGCLTVGLSIGLTACGGGGGGGGGSGVGGAAGGPLTVTVASAAPSVPPGTSTLLTATVTNDPGNRGVNWTVSCPTAPCGSVSPLQTPSGVATTYSAPGSAQATDLPVTITATSVSEPGVSKALALQIPAVYWSYDIGGTVTAGTTAQFVVSLLNDSASRKFTWAVSCTAADCGSISPTTSVNGVAVTYTAPAVAPPEGLAVTITVTPVDLAGLQLVDTITIPAVALSVAPVSALLPLNVSQTFAATVSYDDTGKGVTWALSQNGAPCSPACGTDMPLAAANGPSTTYTAPATLPATPSLYVTATSVTDTTKWASAAVTLTNGSVSLVPADLTLSGEFKQLTAILTNTINLPLNISGMAFAGADPGDFSESDDCGAVVAAGASCKITVTYKCVAIACKRVLQTAVLNITDSSLDSPQQLHLTGYGKAGTTAALHEALRSLAMAAAPRPTGASQVGTRLMHMTDAVHDDPYLADGTKRELMVRLWYPTPGNAPCTPAPYTSAAVLSEISQLLGATTLPQISTNSCLDAPVAAGAHPIVVITHGFTGTFTDYTFLTEDLASRGYVVASVDHTYEATAVEFPNGTVAKSVFGSHLTSYTRSDPQALAFAVSVRIGDLSFVLDELAALAKAREGVFAGKLDLSRIALAGHSLGGLTAVRGVEHDARFRAAISLDGLVPDRLTLPTWTPVLLLTAGRSRWNENDCQLWSALQGVRLAVNFNGAEHTAFSDALWLGHGAVATGRMGMDKTVTAIRDVSAAFLDAAFAVGPMNAPAIPSLLTDLDTVVTTQAQSRCGPG